MDKIHFDEQVVLITGAGRGLGAAYAKLIGARGATVVVHDAGVDRSGQNPDPAIARELAERIRSSGGDAVAETNDLSSESCEELVERTVERFGRRRAIHSGTRPILGSRTPQLSSGVSDERECRGSLLAVPGSVTLHERERLPGGVLTVSGYGLKQREARMSPPMALKAAGFAEMNGLAGEGMRHGILANAVLACGRNAHVQRSHQTWTTLAGVRGARSGFPGVVCVWVYRTGACGSGRQVHARRIRFVVGTGSRGSRFQPYTRGRRRDVYRQRVSTSGKAGRQLCCLWPGRLD